MKDRKLCRLVIVIVIVIVMVMVIVMMTEAAREGTRAIFTSPQLNGMHEACHVRMCRVTPLLTCQRCSRVLRDVTIEHEKEKEKEKERERRKKEKEKERENLHYTYHTSLRCISA